MDEQQQELLLAIVQLVNEVNDHLQDEQGDWDERPVNQAWAEVYRLMRVNKSVAEDFIEGYHFGCIKYGGPKKKVVTSG